MKYIRMICMVIASILLVTSPSLAAHTEPQQAAIAYLRKAGIMVGNEHGEMLLDQGLTRAQMAAIITRMVANPEYVEAESTYYRRQCGFTDVPDWAQVYVGYCAANHYVAGYGNRLYGSNDPVAPAAACTVMLRCLGDVAADWNYTTACRTALDLGLASAEMLAGTEISRGNMALLICRTMEKMGYEMELPKNTVPSSISGSISYNDDGSINVPSDGAQYTPQTGDVIRCDDGSNYSITDVSRYDKNMFASGPVGNLPEPTCDWSLLPQPVLPPAEVRHFTLKSGEYMFVRNLFETRRMLYTLYNAIGGNPETWQGGKLALHPSGNPKIRINLTISDDTAAESFWPWRESKIVEPFHANPCGIYSLEAWDVYKDGVFQRTEYMVHHTA